MSEVDDEIDAPQRPPRPPLTAAQRRARRQTITLLVVCGMLLVAFVFAAAYYGGWFGDEKATTGANPCTTATPTSTVKPSQVKVNVYNASNRNGLARKVAGEMRLLGFNVASVANDPLHRSVKTTVEVRYGTKGKAGAQLVGAEVDGSKLVADKRKDATVDLVLGASYTQLKVTEPTPTGSASCTPTATTAPTTGVKATTSPGKTPAKVTTSTKK